MKYICLTAVALTVLALGLQSPAQAQPQFAATNTVFLPIVIRPFATGQTPEQYQAAQQVLALVNNERAGVGCAPLSINDRLIVAAQRQSQDMALNDFFSHTNPDASLSTVGRRATAAGYSWSRVAENIAAGHSTPYDVMYAPVYGWMASGGHRANILNCDYTEIGVGYYYEANDTLGYRHYWTQVFGRP